SGNAFEPRKRRPRRRPTARIHYLEAAPDGLSRLPSDLLSLWSDLLSLSDSLLLSPESLSRPGLWLISESGSMWLSISCSGRRSWLCAYSSYACRSCAVSGGGARLRGHSRRAATTFASTAYRVTCAPR